MLEARASDFDVESYAKVVWMMGRAHHRSPAACALVDTLSERALGKNATPQVRPGSPPLPNFQASACMRLFGS